MNEKAVLYIGANRPIPGRENDATKMWSELGTWIETQQKAGWFSRAKLDEWRRTDEFEAFVFRITNLPTQQVRRHVRGGNRDARPTCEGIDLIRSAAVSRRALR